MTKKSGTKIIFTGIVLTIISFVTVMVNLSNLYGKASETSSCFTKTCSVSNNVAISHISLIGFFVGLVLFAAGIVVFVVASQKSKK